MFKDSFFKVDPSEKADYLQRLKPHLQGFSDRPGDIVIETKTLSFYEGWELVSVTSHDSLPPAKRYIALGPHNEIALLDWSKETLYALNQTAGLALSEASLRDYIHFFFHCVHLPQGPVTLAETVDDINWTEDPDPSARRALMQYVAPIDMTGMNQNGQWHAKAHLQFKDSIFACSLHIERSGHIKISDEVLILEDMPVQHHIVA